MKLNLTDQKHPARKPHLRPKFAAPAAVPDMFRLRQLSAADSQETLDFLARRPVHTVVMSSWINDNGIESTQNRGRFYAYRGAAGEIEGVALIGHTTLVEARSADALRSLALIARETETPIHMMMSDSNTIEAFWNHYAGGAHEPRLVCQERFFEIKYPLPLHEFIPGLKLAGLDELDRVAEAHAAIAFAECGVNPLAKDRAGFLRRVARRIEQKRTWTVVDEETGKLIFKTDVVAETSDVSYLEGIYVHSDYRGKGIAANCLSQLSRILLAKVKHVCLLSNEDFQNAHRSYRRAGFKAKDCFVTIFA